MIEQTFLSFNLFHVKHSPNRSSPLLSFSFSSGTVPCPSPFSLSACLVPVSRAGSQRWTERVNECRINRPTHSEEGWRGEREARRGEAKREERWVGGV